MATVAAFAMLGVGGTASAAPTLDEYRYFRALSIDLQGRLPTRAELVEFESPGFDLDSWVEARLSGPDYAERIRRIYMDLLRLDVGPQFEFVPKATLLRRHRVLGPDGEPVWVYFRYLQRRQRVETDGAFCLTQAETGLQFPLYDPAFGNATPVSQQVLDDYTVEVEPWWLYRDYRDANPNDRYDAEEWKSLYPNFVPDDGLLFDFDGSTVTRVRVCKEEAQTAEMGTVHVTGRDPPFEYPPPFGRIIPLPYDTPYAKAHAGEPISCRGGTAVSLATECGCGVGLERCLPSTSADKESNAFIVPMSAPIGVERPTYVEKEPTAAWSRLWWGQEAIKFFDVVIGEDRDFRDLLRAPYSFVNGPLAQFHGWVGPSTCCGGDLATSDYRSGSEFGYAVPEPLFDPSALPTDLRPHDTTVWREVVNRGPRASGFLTMPIFLSKYGSRRAKAHALYKTFLCREFVADDGKLPPSNEPNLMIREGCATCHVTLEPMAAYFTRIMENDWTYLPEEFFPLSSQRCASSDPDDTAFGCDNFYDPAFTDAQEALLRGAYGSFENAELGPRGLADALIASDEFATCVATNIASSYLGRALGSEDEELMQAMSTAFVDSGYRLKPLVRTLLRSKAYRYANNLTSGAWRGEREAQ